MPFKPNNPVTGDAFQPMLNIPEIFGKAMSYEDQVQIVLALWKDALDKGDTALVSQINDAIKNALDKANDAQMSAENAQAAADNAQNAANDAQMAAGNAQAAADSAQAAAEESQEAYDNGRGGMPVNLYNSFYVSIQPRPDSEKQKMIDNLIPLVKLENAKVCAIAHIEQGEFLEGESNLEYLSRRLSEEGMNPDTLKIHCLDIDSGTAISRYQTMVNTAISIFPSVKTLWLFNEELEAAIDHLDVLDTYKSAYRVGVPLSMLDFYNFTTNPQNYAELGAHVDALGINWYPALSAFGNAYGTVDYVEPVPLPEGYEWYVTETGILPYAAYLKSPSSFDPESVGGVGPIDMSVARRYFKTVLAACAEMNVNAVYDWFSNNYDESTMRYIGGIAHANY